MNTLVENMIENTDFDNKEYYCHNCDWLFNSADEMWHCAREHPEWIQVSERAPNTE